MLFFGGEEELLYFCNERNSLLFQFDNQAFMNMNSIIGRFFIVLSLSMSSWLGFAQEVVMMNVHQGHSVAAFESGAVDSVTFTADAHDYDKRMG